VVVQQGNNIQRTINNKYPTQYLRENAQLHKKIITMPRKDDKKDSPLVSVHLNYHIIAPINDSPLASALHSADTGRGTTVCRMIQFPEWTQCVESFGFPEYLNLQIKPSIYRFTQCAKWFGFTEAIIVGSAHYIAGHGQLRARFDAEVFDFQT
jgi:hypothetical protein